MRKQYVEITTHDTKKTYRFPPEEGVVNPQLWETRIQIRCLGTFGMGSPSWSSAESIHLERSTLERVGLLPKPRDEQILQVNVKKKTPEDLLLELLETVGVYPTE